jgi:alpha-ketoglutarate-dependent taurine dioxygenase
MSAPALAASVTATPEVLRVAWANGTASEFASLWLRDNRPEDRDPGNGQRLIDVTDLPEKPRMRSALLRADSVLVEWQDETPPTSFGLEWLARCAAGSGREQPAPGPEAWLEGATLDAARDFAWTTLAAARSDPATRLAWLTRLLVDGIAFLSGVPSEEPAILDAVSLIGRVTETNYGLVFDVRSVPQPENLAYSDLGLGLHTDNPYRDPVPGFQALHVLVASREGGASLFADGFAIAAELRARDPAAFDLLTRTAVPFLYRSRDAELYAERPLIQLSCRGEVVAVHYNSRSIAPLRLPAGELGPYYAAYRRFGALLRDARFQLRLRLDDGDLVVFDNQRVLHGRTAFSSARYSRHLRGCYLSRDSVHSETALLRRRLDSRAGT